MNHHSSNMTFFPFVVFCWIYLWSLVINPNFNDTGGNKNLCGLIPAKNGEAKQLA